jgi:hypothetical protein
MKTDVLRFWDALYAEKDFKDNIFCPENPAIVPFDKQLAFLQDEALTKLAQCGNRSAKTFTNMRDLSWRLMRRHPYIPGYMCSDIKEYMDTKPKIFWMSAPDLTFINDTVWKAFLNMFIPQWYYTNDDLVPMIQTDKVHGVEFVQGVTFRNGDTLAFRSYTQSLLSKMGAKVDGGVWLDEAPKDLKMLTELIVRCLDGDGVMSMGFTPVDVPEDIVEYIEKHKGLSRHRWSMYDNPVFRDNPARLARALAEFEGLDESERHMRIFGDWCYTEEIEPGDPLFENMDPEVVEDFPIPASWRRARFLDPAGHKSGLCIFAEDPKPNEDGTTDWYCELSRTIEWKGKTVKATDIEKEVDDHANIVGLPEGYRYFLSVYDNAENWYAAHCEHKRGQWIPCLLKNVERSITSTRNAVSAGRVKFFRFGAAKVISELQKAKRGDDGKPKLKKLHCVDALRYFCEEIPPADPEHCAETLTEEQKLVSDGDKAMVEEWENYDKEKTLKYFERRRVR